ncbi:hypothetical protein N5853_02765 [Bartonella sp. HY329]|uniref:DUF7822 domain-containing protein n=1 Tax=unclassified Bartonella TaxID=2645622 RepID=UPI0021C95277|nr:MULTISPECIES: hypothetical protein [unclassified Bartonella]UXM95571.1 hypothetical protein N5853_02765 [Bartonella sp. HY329]UXN09896.1 hypothetical protein N5852_02775 [Bartonella sp. HY328]
MANRTYFYGISDYSPKKNVYPEVVFGLGDQPYAIPFFFRLLVSGNPQCVSSLIFSPEDDDDQQLIPAIIGDGDIGYARFQKIAGLMKDLARNVNPFMIEAFEEVQENLSQKRVKYYLLETYEIDVLEKTNDFTLVEWVEMECKICQQIGTAVDNLKGPKFWQRRKLSQAMRKNDPKTRLNHLTLSDTFDHINRGNAMLGLAALSAEPFYMPYTRAEFEAEQETSNEYNGNDQ